MHSTGRLEAATCVARRTSTLRRSVSCRGEIAGGRKAFFQDRRCLCTFPQFDFRNGERLIHKNYMAWIQNLVTDIGSYMTMASIE
jgi:hypothetical protein